MRSFGSGVGNVFTMVIKSISPNTKPPMTLYRFGKKQYRIALAPIIKKLPRNYLFMKGNFKNRNHEKEKFKRRD